MGQGPPPLWIGQFLALCRAFAHFSSQASSARITASRMWKAALTDPKFRNAENKARNPCLKTDLSISTCADEELCSYHKRWIDKLLCFPAVRICAHVEAFCNHRRCRITLREKFPNRFSGCVRCTRGCSLSTELFDQKCNRAVQYCTVHSPVTVVRNTVTATSCCVLFLAL